MKMETSFKSITRIYFVLFVISFIINAVWELSHARLYQWLGLMELTIPHLLWFSVKDSLLHLAFVLAVAVAARNLLWFKKPRTWQWVLLAGIGLAVSTLIEFDAIAAGRWAYLSTMPIIPVLEVGLSPILQMTVGLAVVLLILGRLDLFLYNRHLGYNKNQH